MTIMDECPFPGLAPFEAKNASYFFGREIDARVLASNVLTRAITVLYGPSGIGKSSLLGAGLTEAIEEDFTGASIVYQRDWGDASKAIKWLIGISARSKAYPLSIVIFDQFEQYFNRVDPSNDLLPKVLESIFAKRRNIHLLISLRDDSLHLIDAWRFHLPAILDNTLALDYIEDDAARDAVRKPLEIYNSGKADDRRVECDDGFIDTIVRDLHASAKRNPSNPLRPGRRGIELPYLQLTLRRLWRNLDWTSGEPKRLTAGMLAATGGVAGVISRHVDDTLQEISETERLLACRVFHYMVTPTGSKIAHTAEDLTKLTSENDPDITKADVESLLRNLSSGTIRVLRDTGDRFELFHDVLARPILDWRANYLDDVTVFYLMDLFTGEAVVLPKGGNVIGRAAFRTGRMTEISVSRFHFVIFGDGRILDIRSRFGTTVNARSLPGGFTLKLESGDLIGLANTAALRFVSKKAYRETWQHRDTALPKGWALIIDGVKRDIIWCDDPTVYLRCGDDGLEMLSEPAVGTFATLISLGDYSVIIPLDETRTLHRVDRVDAVRDHPTRMEPSQPQLLNLEQVDRDNPTSPSHLEGAKRALFTIDGYPFEIILTNM